MSRSEKNKRHTVYAKMLNHVLFLRLLDFMVNNKNIDRSADW